MSLIVFPPECQFYSSKKIFGLCDDPPPPNKPAYLDEEDGGKWIAVVVNDDKYDVVFTAIDHCLEMKKESNKQSRQCDGMLTYNDTLIFVELKSAADRQNNWIEDGEDQLEITINFFKENNFDMDDYKHRLAYLSNNVRPRFRTRQQERMDKFKNRTGFVLRIEQRITLK